MLQDEFLFDILTSMVSDSDYIGFAQNRIHILYRIESGWWEQRADCTNKYAVSE